jgi:ParB/RepB/Spo0J family partition protein
MKSPMFANRDAAQPDQGLIPIASIILRTDRPYRALDDTKVEELKISMSGTAGQQQKILVSTRTGDRVLVYGRRRYEAANQLGWTNIGADVVAFKTEAEEHVAELTENLLRGKLTPTEKLDWTAQLLELTGQRLRDEAAAASLQDGTVQSAPISNRTIEEAAGIEHHDAHRARDFGKIDPVVKANVIAANLTQTEAGEVAKATTPKQQAAVLETITGNYTQPADGKRKRKSPTSKPVGQTAPAPTRTPAKKKADYDFDGEIKVKTNGDKMAVTFGERDPIILTNVEWTKFANSILAKVKKPASTKPANSKVNIVEPIAGVLTPEALAAANELGSNDSARAEAAVMCPDEQIETLRRLATLVEPLGA